METLTLESALLSELSKDVKLKGGAIATDENGKPLKAFDAIAKSIVNNAMKGDIAAVNFVRNLTRQSDPESVQRRQEEAKAKLAEIFKRMRGELEAENLWIGQGIELEQLAKDWLIIENLNNQMEADDYQDVLQEFKKDGSVQTRINPLHEWRDRYKKQFLQDWKELRIDAQRRKIALKHFKSI